MTKWEYRHEFIPLSKMHSRLNELGQDGWEVCICIPPVFAGETHDCFLKRRVINDAE